jgi:predicted FMN-binding regulatory protein PaiB
MYVPPAFRVDDPTVVAAFMRQFAAVVTNSPSGLVASHVPVLVRGRIVGFEMAIDRCEAKFKLGQNRSVPDRTGAAAGLDRERSSASAAGADFMRRDGGAD